MRAGCAMVRRAHRSACAAVRGQRGGHDVGADSAAAMLQAVRCAANAGGEGGSRCAGAAGRCLGKVAVGWRLLCNRGGRRQESLHHGRLIAGVVGGAAAAAAAAACAGVLLGLMHQPDSLASWLLHFARRRRQQGLLGQQGGLRRRQPLVPNDEQPPALGCLPLAPRRGGWLRGVLLLAPRRGGWCCRQLLQRRPQPLPRRRGQRRGVRWGPQ